MLVENSKNKKRTYVGSKKALHRGVISAGLVLATGLTLMGVGGTVAYADPSPSRNTIPVTVQVDAHDTDSLETRSEVPAPAPVSITAADKATRDISQDPVKATADSNPPQCKNWLVNTLREAGFDGEDLKEAWSIAMRESGGREDAISSTGDYGMFQFNRAAHSDADWWNTNKLLTRDYNAKIAYRMSGGGKNWSAWDLSGTGQWLGNYTPRSTGEKYRSWYNKYPC